MRCNRKKGRTTRLGGEAAYQFLSQYGEIEFLMRHYDIEHTLSLDDAIDDLEKVCRDNGDILHG
jgi:hypothetical protein